MTAVQQVGLVLAVLGGLWIVARVLCRAFVERNSR